MAKQTASFKNVTVVRETQLAILCKIDGKEEWIAKSQIDEDSEVYEEGTEGELIISEWLAKEKGLI